MQSTLSDLAELATRLEALAREAGEIAMGFFRAGERTSASVGFKSGGSPVSEADVAVRAYLDDTRRLNETTDLVSLMRPASALRSACRPLTLRGRS